MNRKSIQITPHGGLGNQLFAYYAGIFFAKKENCHLDIYLGKCDRQHTKKIFDISSYDLDLNGGKFIQPRIIDSPRLASFRRLRDSLIHRVPILRVLDSRFLKHKIEGRDFLINKSIEFKKGQKIEGFFSTFEYFQALAHNKNLSDVSLRTPSKEFLEMDKLMSKSPYISLHLRRGDTVNFKHTTGNLSFAYYQEALEAIKPMYEELPLYLFSDDISEAKALAGSLKWKSVQVISGIFDPAENLLLFSKGKVLLIANSSFSAWASMLSTSQVMTIAPKPYLRNGNWPREWPENWNPQESKWEN